jgi:hypothetical protein
MYKFSLDKNKIKDKIIIDLIKIMMSARASNTLQRAPSPSV